jgi:diguanylate cyclase (GGDEF)-like protein
MMTYTNQDPNFSDWTTKRIIVAVIASVICAEISLELLSHIAWVVEHTFVLVHTVVLISVLITFQYVHVIQPLKKNRDYFWELSNMDSLTHCFNRRYFDMMMENEFTRSSRHSRPLSVLMLDIDDFKNVNDTYGHSAGDFVLHKVAVLLLERSRNYCTVARYGGEEFVIVVPEADCEEALVLAESLRMLVTDTNFKISATTNLKLTISIGVASLNIEIDDKPINLVKRADLALYKAKQNGKNQTFNICMEGRVG